MIDIKSISNKIISKRVELDITQTELAKMLDVMPASIARWETEVNLLRPKHLILLCSILGLTIDELLIESNDLNNKDIIKYKFAKFYDQNSNHKIRLNYKVIQENISEFLDFYINEIIKGNNENKEEYDYLLEGLYSYQKGTFIDLSSIDISFRNDIDSIKLNEITTKAIKIYKINELFNHNNLDYIFEKEYGDFDFDPYSVYKTRDIITDKSIVLYSDKRYSFDVSNFNNHDEINNNIFYVKDSNGYDAIIELIDIATASYDPLIHDKFTFDRLVDYIKIDSIILELCSKKTYLLEKYLLSIPHYRYKEIKNKYINNYLVNNKLYGYGDIFMKIDCLKNN